MFSAAKGQENNAVKVGGITQLFGDPAVKIEKPYTIINFPGGSIELSRSEDGAYWLHAATHQSTPEDPMAAITHARVDAAGRYAEDTNHQLEREIAKGGVNHIAFRFELNE